MSQGTACKCKPRQVVVTARCCAHSAFNGYHYTPSDYSAVKCVRCGASWRTKALFVNSSPDAPEDWYSHGNDCETYLTAFYFNWLKSRTP